MEVMENIPIELCKTVTNLYYCGPQKLELCIGTYTL